MNEIQKIMFGELRPWLESNNQTGEYYKPLARGIKTIQPIFNPHYELNFIRHFSDKTQYYNKLINNELIDYCNTVFEETQNAGYNLIVYKIDKTRKFLYGKIKEISNIITAQNFDLSLIKSQNADFSIDRQFKESTYIVFYLLSAFIKCYLEIQNHFSKYIPADDIWEISDFYTQILQLQAPESNYIKEIQHIEIDNVQEEKKKTETDIILAFTYKRLNSQSGNITDLFNSLKKNTKIAQDTSFTDFKHVFSGIAVENPIYWTGAKSELPYLIKLLCNTHKVLNYSGSLWQIVCACFVDEDGNPYEETNLKDQKKPKLTAALIEKIALLMK